MLGRARVRTPGELVRRSDPARWDLEQDESLSPTVSLRQRGRKTAQVRSVAWRTLGSRLASLQSLGGRGILLRSTLCHPAWGSASCGRDGRGRPRASRGSKVTRYLVDKIPGRAANRQGAAASPSDFGTGGMSWQTFSSSEENKKEVVGAPLSFSSRADLLLFNSSKRSRGQEKSQVQGKRHLGRSCLTLSSPIDLTRLGLFYPTLLVWRKRSPLGGQSVPRLAPDPVELRACSWPDPHSTCCPVSRLAAQQSKHVLHSRQRKRTVAEPQCGLRL